MPGLLYKKDEDKDELELWTCCWGPSSLGLGDTFLYAGLSECIYHSKWADGELKSVQKYEQKNCQAISFLHTNQKNDLFVSTSLSGIVTLWKFGCTEPQHFFKVSPGQLFPCLFSIDGSKIVISGSKEKGGISIIDVQSEKEMASFQTKGKSITCSCFSPDAASIACCNPEGVVEIFDISSGKLAYVMEGHAMPIRSICYSVDSNYLITGSQDSLVKIYDGRNSSFLGSLSGHSSWVTSVSPNPKNSKILVTGSLDGTIKTWDLVEKVSTCSFSEHQKGVWSAQYHNSGSTVGSVGECADIRIIST